MFSKAKGSLVTESNLETTLVVLSLFKSNRGKDIFIQNLRDYSRTLVATLRSFSDYLKKEKIYDLKIEGLNEENFLRDVDNFQDKIERIGREELNGLFKIIESKYTINRSVILEGVILAIHEYVIEKIEFYFNILDVREEVLRRRDSINTIIDVIPQERLLKKENILEFINIKSRKNELKDFDERKMLRDDRERIIKHNRQILFDNIDYRDTFSSREMVSKLELSDRRINRLFKDIDNISQMQSMMKEESIENIDENIFQMIEAFLWRISRLKKEILDKDITNALIG